MQYITAWATPDKRVLAIFTPEVLQKFAEHRQQYPYQAEAGGILLGRRRGKHFEILYATTPFPTDRRRRTSFIRESIGHKREAVAWWQTSCGEIGYVGEWHTHPEPSPTPSEVDRHEWAKLIRSQRPAAAMLITIVGTTALYVALLCQDHAIQEFSEAR